jgi:hypothetical protein
MMLHYPLCLGPRAGCFVTDQSRRGAPARRENARLKEAYGQNACNFGTDLRRVRESAAGAT